MSGAGEPQDARRILRGLVPAVYLPTSLEVGGRFALLPVLPLIALSLGFTVPAAAAIAIVPGLMAFLGPVPAAKLMQTVGPRPALLGSGTLLVALHLAALVVIGRGAEDGPEGADAVHRVALLLVMLGTAAISTVWALGRQAYLGTRLPAPLRARGMSLFGGTLRIGQVIGPMIGAAVIAFGSTTWVFGLAAALTAAAVTCIALFMLPEERSDGPRLSRRERKAEAARRRTPARRSLDGKVLRRMVIVGAGVAPIMIARVNRPVVVPLIAAALGVEASTVSVVFGLAAVVEIALVVPAGTMMEKLGRAAVVVRCAVLMSAGFLVLGIAALVLGELSPVAALIVLLLPSALISLGNGLGSGLVMTLGVDMSPLNGRTRYLAWWNTMLGGGQLLAPLVVAAVTLVAPVAWTAILSGALLAGGGLWAARTMSALTPGPTRRP